MASPSHELFRAILQVANLPSKHYKNGARVELSWDINAGYVSGTFKIPLQTDINPNTGKYIVTALDFIESEQTTPSQGLDITTLSGMGE